MEIKVKYHDEEIDKIAEIPQGDWLDLRAAEDVTLEPFEFKLISLGVSMQLPEGYEGELRPRSSTYKKWKIIQTNSVGTVDNSYCGDGDIWYFPALAIEKTTIHKNDRICQFRIVKTMRSENPDLKITTVEYLDNKNRGGIGSTGVN